MASDSATVIVGAGLAGLSCAFELAKAGRRVTVLESRPVLGGRTSSWVEDGMSVESGLHKYLGIYRALPKLMHEVGVDLSDMLSWVDELSVRHPDRPEANFVVAPYRHPVGTLASVLGNNELVPFLDKAKLSAFGAAGVKRCVAEPEELDRVSVAQCATEFGVSPETIHDVLSTVTQAVLFRPAASFSAYAAFSPVVEGLKHLMTFRLGAFRGGMTEVMIRPIAQAIERLGGSIHAGVDVRALVLEGERLVGLTTSAGQIRAEQIVLAVPLQPAKGLLEPCFRQHPWFEPLFQLPSMSAVTVQCELDAPSVSSDRTNFSSTRLCCFAEQSRTTFQGLPGRLSAILYPPDQHLEWPDEELLDRVCQDADQLGLPVRGHVVRYRVIRHPHDFYAMVPGSEALRPTQRTPIPGLTLAGDYTKQPWSASMEGAVVSGQRAAAAVLQTAP